ncbi:ATP-binding cassette domain-containing protein [Enorma massiliensis]|uniref:ATP-binding cassette domain-containing protein n=1 Tax=Enorma massiliensis TaxID=1472761 RepID=UPI003AB8A443
MSFRNVRFGYGDEEVLYGVSFDAQEGRVTALVGPSGSGKSTCAQLAAKYWEPDSGRILCSGKDIAEFSEESWLTHILPSGDDGNGPRAIAAEPRDVKVPSRFLRTFRQPN